MSGTLGTRSGASGVACLDVSFAVSAMRARECRLYSALSIIAPSVNVLRRTRRNPSTIRGAAPDVVIGQSTAARAGAHPSYGGCQAWIVGAAVISFFKCDGVAIFAVMRKVFICLNALRRELAD